MLSPKTPSQISTCYPELFSTLNSAAAEREPGLGAFDSYGMGYTGNYEGLTSQNSHNFDIDSSRNTLIGHDGNNSGHSISHTSPRETTQHSKSSGAKANVHGNFNSNTFSSMPPPLAHSSDSRSHGLPPSSAKQSTAAVTKTNHVSESSKNVNNHAKTYEEQKERVKRHGRKATMSLNPEDREALEDLVENVVIGGMSDESTSSENEHDDDVKSASESTSDEKVRSPEVVSDGSDTKRTLTKSNSKEKLLKQSPKDSSKKDPKLADPNQKVYPPQLKVAVKHMKNLPPRFLRKIQTNKDDDSDGRGGKLTEKQHRIQELPEPPMDAAAAAAQKPVEVLTKAPQREGAALAAAEAVLTKERDARSSRERKKDQKMEKKKEVRMFMNRLENYCDVGSGPPRAQVVSSIPSADAIIEKLEARLPEMAIIAPVNENPYSSEKLTTHSAPASAQVSPNTQGHGTVEGKVVDIGQLDPAIKAQGPPVSAMLQQLMHQAAPQAVQLAATAGSHQPPPHSVPDSPGMNCEELEREMFQTSSSSSLVDHNQRLQQQQQPPPAPLLAQQQAAVYAHANQSLSSAIPVSHHDMLSAQHAAALSPTVQHHHQYGQSAMSASSVSGHVAQTLQSPYNHQQQSAVSPYNPSQPPPGLGQYTSMPQVMNSSAPAAAQTVNHYAQLRPMGTPVRMPFGMHLQHQQQQYNNKSQFSVDAPEFVPRTFSPSNLMQPPLGAASSLNTSQSYPVQSLSQPQLHHMTYVNSAGVPAVVSSSQSMPLATLVSSGGGNSQVQLPAINPHALQGPPPPLPVQIPDSFSAPPPPLPQSMAAAASMASPQQPIITTMAPGLTAAAAHEQQLAAGLGRSSPQLPAGQMPPQPAFMIPKVSTQTVAPAAGLPHPSMGLVYAPVYPQYPPGIHPSQLHHPPFATGPFLVQAWSGGRKEKFHTSNTMQLSHPAMQKTPTGMVNRQPRGSSTPSALHGAKNGVTASTKVPHRAQSELSPQQTKEKVETLIAQGKKVMVIMRGLPGSGKSTIAK